MFCIIMALFSLVDMLLFIMTNSPLFWYATLCALILLFMLMFIDAELKKKSTRLVLLVLLSGAALQAYEYGSHIAGVDWEILITQSALLALAIGYDSLPFHKQESQAI